MQESSQNRFPLSSISFSNEPQLLDMLIRLEKCSDILQLVQTIEHFLGEKGENLGIGRSKNEIENPFKWGIAVQGERNRMTQKSLTFSCLSSNLLRGCERLEGPASSRLFNQSADQDVAQKISDKS